MSAKIPPKIPPKAKKPLKDTVYVDIDDDITAIINKVETAKNKVVALVLPKRSSVLQSVVNMRLLKRGADNADKNAVLITSEASLLPLAGIAGIHVAKNLQSLPEIPPTPIDAGESKTQEASETEEDDEENIKTAKLDHYRSMGGLASAETVEEPETIALEDDEEAPKEDKQPNAEPDTPKDKKLKIPNFERFRIMIALGILGLVGLITFIILALVVWPHATVTIQTESSPVTANLTLTASDSTKTLDETKKAIPASLKSSDQTSNQQIQATGQQNNGQKATGTVTVSASCPAPIPNISQGTGMSSSGLTFITTAALHLANTNQVGNDGNWVCKGDVTVTAQQGGAKYNLAANSSFTIAGYSGSNGSALTGGTDNNVTVVSQTDLENAKKTAITTQATNDFTSKFEKSLSDQNLYVLTSTLKAADPVITATPSVGQPASTVSVSIKITYSVLTVTKSDLQKIVGDALSKQIDASRQKLSNDDPLQGATVTVQSQSSPTTAALSVSETTTAMPILDVPGIKKQIGGQKSGNIKNLVTGIPGVKDAQIKMSPFWVSKAPKAGKITIVLQQSSD